MRTQSTGIRRLTKKDALENENKERLEAAWDALSEARRKVAGYGIMEQDKNSDNYDWAVRTWKELDALCHTIKDKTE